VSVAVNAFGTSKLNEEQLVALVRANFNMTPKGMIETLKLRRPVFRPTSFYGHFGRTGDGFTWEKTDKANALKEAAAAAKA
jgi:S-adenosylmethionine synthetase